MDERGASERRRRGESSAPHARPPFGWLGWVVFALPLSCALDWDLPAGPGGAGGAGGAPTSSTSVGGSTSTTDPTSVGGSTSTTDPTSVGGAGGGAGGPPTEEVQCQTYARWVCGKMLQCDEIGFNVLFGEKSRCEAHGAALCLGSGTTPDTAKTPAFFANCAEKWPDLNCSAYPLLQRDIGAFCAFSGTRGSGAACIEDGQCQSGACFFQKDAACGTCVPRSPVGGACNVVEGGRGLQCVPEGYCKPDEDIHDGDEVCAPYVGHDGQCGPHGGVYLHCVPGLHCVYSEPGGFGTCQLPQASVKGACAPEEPGELYKSSPDCSPGQNLLCVGGTCELATYGNPGDACAPVGATPETGAFHLCRAGFCGGSGRCVPIRVPGEACGFEGPCGPGESDGCCLHSACVEGQCEVQPAPACD